MFSRRELGLYREALEHIRWLQESGPVDEEVGNRLQKVGDELAEVERMLSESRSMAAQAMRQIRGILRQHGVAVPAMTRAPTAAEGARPIRGADSIVYASAEAGPCVVCGEASGWGPIGWAAEPEAGPVCDECLQQRTTLWMLTFAANFLRETARDAENTDDGEYVSSALLGTLGKDMNEKAFGPYPDGNLSEAELIRWLEEIKKRNEKAAGAAPGDAEDGP